MRKGRYVMEKSKASLGAYREQTLFERREQVQPHMSYAHEKERHRVIKEGRIDMLDLILQIPADGTAGILSRDELRNQKNMLIAAITMFTRFAMDGGLSEELAYAMSDSYILKGEECTTIEEIDRLYNRAFREFTYAVAERGNRHYRSQIEAAIHYIEIHLHEKITLEKIADAVALSPCHLSRVFRQETGLSVVDYVQKERVGAAKHMLIYSDATLSAISQYLHFSTQSYFIKIFKKYVGITPGQYRKSYHEFDEW